MPASQPVWVGPKQIDFAATRWAFFRFLWLVSVFCLILDPANLFGRESINSIERSILLLAGIMFTYGKPLKRWALMFLGMMFFATFISALGTTAPEFKWTRYVVAVISQSALFIFLLARPYEREQRMMLTSVALLPFLNVLAGCALNVVGLHNVFGTDTQLGTVRLQGSTGSAFLSGLAFAGATASALIWSARERKAKWLFAVAGNLAISMLSGSRSGTVAAIGVALAIIFYSFRSWSQRALMVVVSLFCLAALLAVAGEGLLTRVQNGGDSGRTLIWNDLKATLDRYPGYGVGLGHIQDVVSAKVRSLTGTAAAHNEFMRMAVEVGYLDSALFWLFLLLLICASYWEAAPRQKPMIFWFVVGYAGYSYTDNTMVSIYVSLPLITIIVGTSQPLRTLAAPALAPAPHPPPPRRMVPVLPAPEPPPAPPGPA